MRVVLAAFACLAIVCSPIRALAEDKGIKEMPATASIVAYLGTIKFAVMKAPPSSLGYYYDSAGAKKILFYVCGDPNAAVKELATDEIQETTEECDSLPRKPRTPLLSNVLTWTSLSTGDFVVSTADFPMEKPKTIVKCADVPIAYLQAAKKQAEQKKGIVVSKELKPAEVEVLFGAQSGSVSVSDTKATSCSKVPSFWTVRLPDVDTQAGVKQVVGLTVADPSDVNQVNALAEQLKWN
jgi:hypothetical protein